MKQETIDKEKYVTPVIEVIEFSLEESIALSTDSGSGTICIEEMY